MRADKLIQFELYNKKPREKKLIDYLNSNGLGGKEALMRALEFEMDFGKRLDLVLKKLEELVTNGQALKQEIVSLKLDTIEVTDEELSEDDLKGL